VNIACFQLLVQNFGANLSWQLGSLRKNGTVILCEKETAVRNNFSNLLDKLRFKKNFQGGKVFS